MSTLTHSQMVNIRKFLFSDPIAVEAFKRLYYVLAGSVDDIQLDYRENKDNIILGVKREGERLRFYLIRKYGVKNCSIRFADPEIKAEEFNPLKLEEYKSNLISISQKVKSGKLDLQIKRPRMIDSNSESGKSRDNKSLQKFSNESAASHRVRYNLRKRNKTITGHYHPEKGAAPQNFDFIKTEAGTLIDTANDVLVTIKFKVNDPEQLNVKAISDLLMNGAELDSIHFYQKKKDD